MRPALKWIEISEEQMQAEREASRCRQTARNIAPRATNNPQFAGLHLDRPRIPLGNGAYKLSNKRGHSFGGSV